MPQLADGDTLTHADYDTLVCCGRPMLVGHATAQLPIAGATCETCLCVITSQEYGPIHVNACSVHRA
ncbi:hypothetical protein AB0D10_05225 [Kitasatospora sp. NPDC048545]|uniref:hypothetical protein n=1 Tax=Kitasatospora sp. NPDC048545 TaxID=3157208 RepID=UPI0033D176C3